jgi:adenylyltransferase/sulfurtransferase
MPNPQPTDETFELPVNPAWEVHPADVKKSLDAGEDLLLLDVRQFREWNYARIEGATLVPMAELEQKAHTDLSSMKNRRIVTLCHVGGRSLRAAAFLRHAGFENVHSMAGGIEAWSLLIDPTIPRY